MFYVLMPKTANKSIPHYAFYIISGEINSDLVKNLTIQIFLMSNNGFKRLIYLYKPLLVLSFTTNDV